MANNNDPQNLETPLVGLFEAMVKEFENEEDKLNTVLQLMSVILTPPENSADPFNKPETINEAVEVYSRVVGENNANIRNTVSRFNEEQKNAIVAIFEYLKNNEVKQKEAIKLIEMYSSGMQGGSKKKRKNTRRRRNQKKSMKKRKTRGRK